VVIASALNVLGLRQVVLSGALAELPVSAVEYLSEGIRADAMWARFGSIVCRTASRRRLAGMVSLAIDRTLLVRERISVYPPLTRSPRNRRGFVPHIW